MTINQVKKIDDLVPIRNVLISVSDKNNIGPFAVQLIEVNPSIKIFSTGGTYDELQAALARAEVSYGNLIKVSDYTGQPETQGGLVKTLDFKIYISLLTETYNEAHQADLTRTGAVPFDMVVCNLYRFRETIAKAGVTVEMARGNIDIGGPCMIRAAAKNFIRVAAVVQSSWYPFIINELRNTGGCISLETRLKLKKIAFWHTAEYDKAIAQYAFPKDISDLRSSYEII